MHDAEPQKTEELGNSNMVVEYLGAWRRLSCALLLGCASLAHAETLSWKSGPGEVAYADRAVGDDYIVLHQAPALASYRGGLAGLAPTAAAVLGALRLDAQSNAALAYLDFLELEQTALIKLAEAALGRTLNVTHRMQHALNALVIKMSPEEALKVAGLPGVARVEAPIAFKLHSDNGPAWIHADALHDGSGTYDGVGSMGEGVVIGVIDTGVNYNHPSFAAVGPVDGYVHTNPRVDPLLGLPRYYGLCAPAIGLPFCNDKLIGVWDFTGTTPIDDNGHGSHTASTAGGNIVDATLQAPTATLERRIGGVAPHANLITYKGCLTTPLLGTCLSPATALATNQAVIDGVDVLNFSIGGTSSDPWSDINGRAFLAATEAGVFVATSAGNDGPAPETLGSPADAPWLLSVAASTHDRALNNALIDLHGGATTPPGDIAGRSLTSALPQAEIVYAGDVGDPLCQTPFEAGTFDGKIVVCDRGVNGRVEKGDNVVAGGAIGFVLANDEANGASLNGDGYAVPGVHITYKDGVALKAWLADGGPAHYAAIAGTTPTASRVDGDVMAGFSSRGPNPAVPGLVKPDITAPGVDIIAAVQTGLIDLGLAEGEPEFGVLSGTSMSSPHAAGAAALIRALHPDWTPDQVKSALMTTAYVVRGKNGSDGLVKDDRETPADALDLGAGRIDLAQAARAGLLLDESADNYRAADPAAGGDPTTLNLPSLGHAACQGSCSWTRTLHATVDASWRVSVVSADGLPVAVTPDTFTLAAGEDIVLSLSADTDGYPAGTWVFADVVLSPDDAAVPQAHLPVAVLPGVADPTLDGEGSEAPDEVPSRATGLPRGGALGSWLLLLVAVFAGLRRRRN